MAWYRAGGGGIPSSLKTGMNSVLNKKFGTSTTYDPAGWPDDVNLLGKLPEKTVSGTIAHITDGADTVPCKSVKCSVVPSGGNGTPSSPVPIVGVSSITVKQRGKNLANINAVESCSNTSGVGSSIVQNNDGTITVTATTQANVKSLQKLKDLAPLKVGETYTLSATSTGTTKYIYLHQLGQTWNFGENKTITETALESEVSFYASGNNTSATISDFMIRPSSDSSATYEQYTAIADVTAQIGQTVYGGQYDFNTGVFTATHEIVTLSESQIDNASSYTYSTKVGIQISNAFPDNIIRTETNENDSSHDIVKRGSDSASHYMWFGSANGNKYLYWVGILDFLSMTLEQWQAWAKTQTIQLRYPLATPIEITGLDTHIFETVLGVNNFWADEGDSSVTYRADIDLALGGN